MVSPIINHHRSINPRLQGLDREIEHLVHLRNPFISASILRDLSGGDRISSSALQGIRLTGDGANGKSQLIFSGRRKYDANGDEQTARHIEERIIICGR